MRGGNSDITILPNINMLQCILNVVGTKLKVSFDVPNSLASALGSPCTRATWSVNSILVHCNIHYSYMRGVQAPVVYNFFPNAATGIKQFNLPVTVDVISTFSVWLTDQHGKLLDLRGE